MNSLTVSLLLPLSGIVVSAVLVAVSRNKKKRDADVTPGEIDVSWLEEYEKAGRKKSSAGKKGGEKQKKAKAAAAAPVKKAPVAKAEAAAESSSSSSEDDDTDDLQLLAAIQKNGISSVRSAVQPTVRYASAATIPPSTSEEQEEGWKAVPTKEELVISSLRNRIGALEASLAGAQEEKCAAEKSLGAAQEKANRLEADLKERTGQFQMRLAGVEADLGQQRSHSQMLSKRLAALETGELVAAKEESGRLAAIVKAREEHIAQLSSERGVLLERLTGVENEAASWKEEANQLKASLEGLQAIKSKHANLEAQFAKVQQALFATEADVIALRSQEAARAAENKHELASLSGQVQDEMIKSSQLEEQLARAITKATALTGELEALRAAKSESEGALREAEEKIRPLERSLAESEADKTKLAEALAALEASRKELSSVYAEKEELEAKLSAESQVVPVLRTRISDLEEALSAMTQRCTDLEDAAAKEEQQQDNATVSSAELESAQGELAAVKKAFAEHLSKSFGLKGRVQELEQENMHLTLQYNILKTNMYKQAAESATKGKKVVGKVDASEKKREASPSPSVASR